MTNTERRTYLNHIRRLQAENAMLCGALYHERKARQEAYKWYQERLNHKWWFLFSAFSYLRKLDRYE